MDALSCLSDLRVESLLLFMSLFCLLNLSLFFFRFFRIYTPLFVVRTSAETNDAAKYVCKSEGKRWTYQEAKAVISKSVEMDQSTETQELLKLVEEQSEMYPLCHSIALAYHSVLKDCEQHCSNEGWEVKKLGGLHVIGTSLHESRRIDNQVSNYKGVMVQIHDTIVCEPRFCIYVLFFEKLPFLDASV